MVLSSVILEPMNLSIYYGCAEMTADAGVDVEKEEYSSIVGGIVSLYNHSGNQSVSSSENWT
jgi:hypothetical protein